MPINGYFTAIEAAEYLSTPEREVHDFNVRDWLRKGLLRGQRMGNAWVVTRGDLDAFVMPDVPEFHYTLTAPDRKWRRK